MVFEVSHAFKVLRDSKIARSSCMSQSKRPEAPQKKNSVVRDRLGIVLKILVVGVLLTSLGIWPSLPTALAANSDRALQIGVMSDEGKAISRMSYTVTVPAFPTVQAQGAYEFHAGVLSSDSSTLVKTTVSYGCQIGLHQACYPPFLNRYIFYISVIQTASGDRVQAPPGGWVLTSGSTYIVVLTSQACPSQATSEWVVRITNATGTLSTSTCLTEPMTFTSVVAGMLEAHEIGTCSQLSSSGSVSQSEIRVSSRLDVSLPLSWSQFAIPNISCGIGVSVSNNNRDVQIFWSPTS